MKQTFTEKIKITIERNKNIKGMKRKFRIGPSMDNFCF